MSNPTIMTLHNYKTTNPAFSREVWKGYASTSKKMTVNGVILKSLFCIFLVSSSAILTWEYYQIGFNINTIIFGGLIGVLVFGVLTAFIHRMASILVPLYALSQGIFIGGVTIYAENKFSGMPIQAIGVTICTFFLMLFLYKSRIVKVSQRFKSVLVVAIAIIMTIYALSWSLHVIGIKTPFIIVDPSSYLAIAFNVLAAGIAAFTLLLDFDFIERKKNHVPRYMEWVAAWGLLVTLVWVYFEAIRLMKRVIIN